MNYGTLVIVDGSDTGPLDSDDRPRRGFVRLGGALAPRPPQRGSYSGSTFVVDLNYSDLSFVVSDGVNKSATDISVSYSRQFKRLASGGNPLKDAKEFVAMFAGCDEAHKLRKRAIALARTKRSISGIAFRFPVEGP